MKKDTTEPMQVLKRQIGSGYVRSTHGGGAPA